MMRSVRNRALALCTLVAVLALEACGSQGQTAVPAVPLAPGLAGSPSAAPVHPLNVLPKKLAFTTTRKLKLRISERKYRGKFAITVTPAGIVRISSRHPKGPDARVIVTAQSAGAAVIVVRDDAGGLVPIQVRVTQGVIVIQ